MEIFKLVELDNEDILLKKTKIDMSKYVEKRESNGDILLKKVESINIENVCDIKKYDFTKSKIISCIINNTEINETKYKKVLEYIYNLINDGTKIIKNTFLNVKTIEKTDDGFYYLKKLGISVQGVDSKKCLLEILSQCISCNIQIRMKIKLSDNKIININNL